MDNCYLQLNRLNVKFNFFIEHLSQARYVPVCSRLISFNQKFKEFFMRFNGNIGMILLAIYLILIGIISIFGVAVPGIVLGILALVSGILILVGR